MHPGWGSIWNGKHDEKKEHHGWKDVDDGDGNDNDGDDGNDNDDDGGGDDDDDDDDDEGMTMMIINTLSACWPFSP